MNFSRRQIALAVSLLFHAALLGVLIVWYVPNAKTKNRNHAASSTTVDESDLNKELDTKPLLPPPQPIDVPDEQIVESVESKLADVQRLTDDQKRSELDKNLQRLESVSSPESVKVVSDKIAKTMGLDTQQYADKERPVGGEFEIDSAQIKDVLRSSDENGGWVYESVMVDADGREMTVPLTAAEGQQLYETFDRLKQFPMAKGIYQSVVMPMMQKMLEESQTESDL